MVVYYNIQELYSYVICGMKVSNLEKNKKFNNLLEVKQVLRKDLYQYAFSKLCINRVPTVSGLSKVLNKNWGQYKIECDFSINSNALLQTVSLISEVSTVIKSVIGSPIANNYVAHNIIAKRISGNIDLLTIQESNNSIRVYKALDLQRPFGESTAINMLASYLYYTILKDFKNVNPTVVIKLIDLNSSRDIPYKIWSLEELRKTINSVVFGYDNQIIYPNGYKQVCNTCKFNETCLYKI